MHLPSSQEVKVDMVNALPCLSISVHHQAEPPPGDPLFFRDLSSYPEQMTYKEIVLSCYIQGGGYVLFGDNQDMHRRLGIYIFKSDRVTVFVDYACRDFF